MKTSYDENIKSKKIYIKSLEKNEDDEIVLYKNKDENKNKRNLIMLNNIKLATEIKLKQKEEDEKRRKEIIEKAKQSALEYKKKLQEEHQRLLEIKKIKEEKERKELEELHKKWEEEKKISMEEKNKRLTESKKSQQQLDIILKQKEEDIKITKEENQNKNNTIITERRKKLLEDKKKIEEVKFMYYTREKEKQMEDHQKIVDIINKYKMRNEEKKELKKEEKNLKTKEKIENRFNKIKSKGKLFLKGELTDLIERLEFSIDIKKILIEEINYNFNRKKNNNLITPDETIRKYNDNYITNILAYFGGELCLYNINTYIEKKPSNKLLRQITFKIITNGLATQRVYKLIFESQKKKNEFKKNMEEWFKFNELIKDRIHGSFNVSKNDIYFFNYDIEKTEVSFIIYNKKINGISLMLKHFGVKTVVQPLLNYIILSNNIFKTEFCRKPTDWPGKNLRRGGSKYYPPYNYYGLSLRIDEKYKKFDSNWFGETGNNNGEWPIAYHGVGKGNVFMKVLSILDDNLKEGAGQLYKSCVSRKNKDEFSYCHQGVYLAPDIDEAEKYAHKTSLGWFKKRFQFVIMARVNPKKIRDPGTFPVNWILNGNDEEIRPYRLLIKIT